MATVDCISRPRLAEAMSAPVAAADVLVAAPGCVLGTGANPGNSVDGTTAGGSGSSIHKLTVTTDISIAANPPAQTGRGAASACQNC